MKNTMKTPVNIPVSKLRPFEEHPFKVKDDEEMNTLIESLQTQGILSPLIVRPIENTDEYEVISGHRRLHAAVKAGITEVPALIYALDRDSAAIVVVDSNLHREHILPSEKAFAYKLKMEALSHQGKRTDLTSPQVVSKLRTGDVIGEALNESRETVRRYIRLTHLSPELLTLWMKTKWRCPSAWSFPSLMSRASTMCWSSAESTIARRLTLKPSVCARHLATLR